MASYKEKNFIADEKPQKVRPGKRTSPGWEYVENLGSSKERVEDWEDKGLDRRAAFASTAIDEIIEELKEIQNRKEVQPGDLKRLSELTEAITDVQKNGENSKWVKDHAEEYYGRTPNPDEYIPEDEGAEKKDPFDLDPKEEGVNEKITEVDIDDTIPTTDEMADFQKSLDDYMKKNPKAKDKNYY